jgi:hypothetical protein
VLNVPLHEEASVGVSPTKILPITCNQKVNAIPEQAMNGLPFPSGRRPIQECKSLLAHHLEYVVSVPSGELKVYGHNFTIIEVSIIRGLDYQALP